MITVKDIFRHGEDYLNKEIELFGWVRKIRDQKKFGFIELNDGSFFKGVQIVFEERLENFDEISRLSISSTIKVKGTLVKSQGSGQDLEVKADKIEIFQKADLEYPLQNKRHTFEYLRTKAHLRPRTNTFSAVFRVRSVLAYALHKFFQENNFVYVHTPIITGSDAEGAGEMFRVTTLDMNKLPKKENGEVDFTKDFFGKSTNLTVSGQLNVETFCAAFRNVYTFGPTFRAEYSNTARHASEFWMIEPEMAFFDLNDDMDIQEEFVKYLLDWALTKCTKDLEFFDKRIQNGLIESLKKVRDAKFVRLTYTDAIKMLEKAENDGAKFEFKPSWGCDIATEHERYLTEKIFAGPVMVYDYPKEIKSFYMKQNDDGKTVKAVDVLVPGIGELIGGAGREEKKRKTRAPKKNPGRCPSLMGRWREGIKIQSLQKDTVM